MQKSISAKRKRPSVGSVTKKYILDIVRKHQPISATGIFELFSKTHNHSFHYSTDKLLNIIEAVIDDCIFIEPGVMDPTTYHWNANPTPHHRGDPKKQHKEVVNVDEPRRVQSTLECPETELTDEELDEEFIGDVRIFISKCRKIATKDIEKQSAMIATKLLDLTKKEVDLNEREKKIKEMEAGFAMFSAAFTNWKKDS